MHKSLNRSKIWFLSRNRTSLYCIILPFWFNFDLRLCVLCCCFSFLVFFIIFVFVACPFFRGRRLGFATSADVFRLSVTPAADTLRGFFDAACVSRLVQCPLYDGRSCHRRHRQDNKLRNCCGWRNSELAAAGSSRGGGEKINCNKKA